MIDMESRKYYSLREIQGTEGFKLGWNPEQVIQLTMILEGLGQVVNAAVPGESPSVAYFHLTIDHALHILVVNTDPAARRTYQYVKARVGSQTLMEAIRNIDSRAQVYGLLKRSVTGLLTTRRQPEIPCGVEFSIAPILPTARVGITRP